ncbi:MULTISPECIES: replication protein [Arsenophonus]|uniref:replication protein n=1 Tax=Arsenophonus TaxID=637 RepID=UPI003879A831
MTNVTYADFEAQKEENKINVIELEEGYTRISNELLEGILTAGLTQHQLLVVMAIIRKTYGYNKKIDWVSNWQISELTGLLPHKCSTAKGALLRRKILISSGRLVGINQCLSEWKDKTCLNEMLPESGNKIKSYPNQVSLPQSGNNNIPKSGKESLPELGKKKTYPNQVKLPESGKKSLPESGKHKRQTTKDNILKPNKPPIVPLAEKSKSFEPSSVELPDWLPRPTWDSWVQYRKEINKPIKSQQTVIQAIKLLGKCRDNGHQPEEIINASIANGWQGLFEPQQPARPQQAKAHSVADSFADKDYGEPQLPDWARECLSREGL